MSWRVAIAVGAGLLLLSPAATAEEPSELPPASGAPPARPRPAPRVVEAPTADLQPAGTIWATAGLSHRSGPLLALTFGLGDVAEVDLEIADRAGRCRTCVRGGAGAAESLTLVTAKFKMGLAEGRFASWQPALALGFRGPVGERGLDEETVGDVAAARLYLAASKWWGPVRLHGGVDFWDAVYRGPTSQYLHDRPLGVRVRPFAGFEWRPPIYPRTTLLADLGYAPIFTGRDGDSELRWLGGWGVRYQVVSWGSIELTVRHRGGDDLGDSTVFIRLNGHFAPLRRR